MFRWLIPTVVTVLVGFVVLLGYLVPFPMLASIRETLVRGAAVLAAFAMLLAYFSLLRVHLRRFFRKGAKHRIASLILVIAALGSLALVLWQGPGGSLSGFLVDDILVPGQSSLLALTAVTLVLGGMRLLGTRRNLNSGLFLLVALLSLLTTVPFVFPDVVQTVVEWVGTVATAGMRGILLGVVLGIVMTGLRIIFGVDRPQSG
ncbi:MAG: hypothetical protein ACP5JG_02795 [Anaerolineae bacterium]